VGSNAAPPPGSANGGLKAPLAFSVPDIEDEDIEAVVRCLRSGWITTGTEVEQFEVELAEYTGARNVVALSSCTAALAACLAALDLPTGSRVGVPAWTFVSTALVVVNQGHVPVLLDVESDSLNLDVEALDDEIPGGLAAVIGVHFGGVPFSPDVRKWCDDRGVPLIEDAAHALGARDDRGSIAGRDTAGACFSFYATKNLATAEGGAIATDDDRLAHFARSYRIHGLTADAYKRYGKPVFGGYDLVTGGIKANMPDVLAAMGRTQLRRFEGMQARRRAAADEYRSSLEGVAGVECLPRRGFVGSADHLMVVRLTDEADSYARVGLALAKRGIPTSVHFQPLHRFRWLDDRSVRGVRGLAQVESSEGRTFSLPLHPRLQLADVRFISQSLREVLDG
jgi:dTDP-4-amino-4,6-dideoxygalactose transaminase